VTGDGVPRRPAAVAAEARGKPARMHGAGQLASALATLGAREASMAVGRRRALAPCGSGNGGEEHAASRGGARGGGLNRRLSSG
jgi:hypothetical protein